MSISFQVNGAEIPTAESGIKCNSIQSTDLKCNEASNPVLSEAGSSSIASRPQTDSSRFSSAASSDPSNRFSLQDSMSPEEEAHSGGSKVEKPVNREKVSVDNRSRSGSKGLIDTPNRSVVPKFNKLKLEVNYRVNAEGLTIVGAIAPVSPISQLPLPARANLSSLDQGLQNKAVSELGHPKKREKLSISLPPLKAVVGYGMGANGQIIAVACPPLEEILSPNYQSSRVPVAYFNGIRPPTEEGSVSRLVDLRRMLAVDAAPNRKKNKDKYRSLTVAAASCPRQLTEQDRKEQKSLYDAVSPAIFKQEKKPRPQTPDSSIR